MEGNAIGIDVQLGHVWYKCKEDWDWPQSIVDKWYKDGIFDSMMRKKKDFLLPK